MKDTYYAEISHYPLLTRRQEEELGARLTAGDVEARDALVTANLRLVVSIVRDYNLRGLPPGDAIDEGNLGLIHAAELFRPEMRCKFSTYATPWIRQSVRNAVRKATYPLRVPAHVFATAAVCRSHGVTDLSQFQGDDSPAARVLSEQKRKNPKRYVDQTRKGFEAIRLNRVGMRDKICPGANPFEGVVEKDEIDAVLRKLRDLDPHERKVITLRFGLHGEPQSVSSVANRMKLPRDRIRQIESNALCKLQEQMVTA